jgi:hypothetical protein
MDQVRIHDWSYASYWEMVYLLFVIPVVASETASWPYSFLKTESWECFLWVGTIFFKILPQLIYSTFL